MESMKQDYTLKRFQIANNSDRSISSLTEHEICVE